MCLGSAIVTGLAKRDANQRRLAHTACTVLPSLASFCQRTSIKSDEEIRELLSSW